MEGSEAFPPSVQQYLLADEPGEVESVFGLLREGLRVCMEEGQGIKEGFEGATASPMTVPHLGDEAFGHRTHVPFPDGGHWDLRMVFVRKGATLMFFQELEVIEADGDNAFSVDEIGEMLERAVDRLP